MPLQSRLQKRTKSGLSEIRFDKKINGTGTDASEVIFIEF